jgi:DNA-binding MarR family transcriptional regulator
VKDAVAEPAADLAGAIFRLEDWLPYEFSIISNRVSAMLARAYTERFRLSVTGWRIVGVLANFQPLSAKQLAERTAMNQVSITRAIGALLRLRMVRRTIDRADRRRVVLRLSEKGLAAYREVIPVAMGIEAELLGGLSAADRAALKRLARALCERAAAVLPETRDWRDFRGPARRAHG